MRNLRRLLITLVIISGLFVVADRVAVRVAENEAASKIQSSQGLAQKPDVSIEGFPFLTQLLGSKLDQVKLQANDMKVNGSSIKLASLKATLNGVRISDNYSSAVADSATGTGYLTYADLSNALPNNTTISYGGTPGKVKVSTTIQGQQVSGTADISVVGGNSVQLNNLDTGDPLTSFLANVFSPSIPLSLPDNLQLQSISAGQLGVQVTVSGTNVHLNG
jgi:hypothetical protein